MLKYEAQIKCDHCGLTLTKYAYIKNDLPSTNKIQDIAKSKGWGIKEKARFGKIGRHLCPTCNSRWGDDE